MADFISEEESNDKNLVLAKLVSIFGDSVDFDVINIVAQENEWNEAKCIVSLTVLGEYKNPPSLTLPEEYESVQLYSEIPDRFVNDEEVTVFSSPSAETMSQKKKPSPPAAAPKAPRSNHSASGAFNRNACVVQDRHLSPAPSSSPKAKERSSESQEHHDQVKYLVSSGTPVLILLRGLPGSGKSTLSKQLLSLPAGKSGCVCSADDFFLVPHGGKGQKEYRFDPLKLEDAHKHCRVQVLQAIAHGVTPIVVDNTNTQAWEMLPYVEMALEPWKAEDILRKMVADGTIAKRNICNSLGQSRNSFKGKKCNCGFTVMGPAIVPYQVELLEPLTWWYRNPSRLAKVNQHGVSQRKITQMLSHFEYGLTGKDLIKQILKKKPQKSHALHPEQQSHPSVTKVRPSKENKPSAQLTGPPLIAAKAKHRNTKANYLPNQSAYGSSQFQQSAANPYPNFVGFPSGPYVQPVLYSPNMFNVGSVGQPGVPKSTEVEFMGSREQAPLTMEGSSTKHSSSNLSIFPGVKPSNLFSSPESELIDSDGSSSENISSKSGVIGRNPFLHSVNSTSNEDMSTSSNFQGKCIEISEEEEREWTQANASKYENWKSSEEESGDDVSRESSEPKPARSYWHRHARLLAAKITGKNTGDSDCQGSEGNDRVAEWVTDEVDPLASWNIPSSASNSDSQKTSDESEGQKNVGPLPPRSPKKRSLIENSFKDSNEAEESEKIANIIEGHEFGWIKDIRLLLKALGLDKDKSDSTQLSSNDNESTSSTVKATVEDNQECDDAISVSIIQDEIGFVPNPVEGHEKTESALNSFEVVEEFNKENSLISKTEDKAGIGSSNAKIHEEYVNECSPPSPKNMHLFSPLVENIVVKPTDMVGNSSVGLIRKNEELANLVADQMETVKMMISNVQEASANDKPVSVFDELQCSQSELTGCERQTMHDKSIDNIFEEAKDISSEKSDHDVCKCDVTGENETLNLTTINRDVSHNSGDKIESNWLHGKTDPGKMTVLKSLLMGIEKAQRRSPQEFESGEKLLEGLPIQDSKSETPSVQLEAEIPPFVSDSMLKKDETSTSSECHENNEAIGKTFEVVHELAPTISTEDDTNKEAETTGEPEELIAPLKEQCDLDEMPSPPDVSTFVGESLCNSSVMRDSYILPSVINLSLEDSSSLATTKMNNNTLSNKTDNLLEFNLVQEENNCESFTVVSNEDIMIDPGSSYLSSALSKCDKGSSAIDIMSNESKTISDFSIEEVWMSLDSTEQIDKMKNTNEIPSGNPAPITAQNIFEKAGNFLLDPYGKSDQKPFTSDSTSSEMFSGLEIAKNLRRDNGIEDFFLGEESQSHMNTNGMEGKDLMNCDDDNDSETYPLVLDHNFVDLLYGTFGNPFEEPLCESPKLPSGSSSGVTINLPGSLARKLHECLLKSQWDSILAEEEISQKMLIEDELLARQLQELENEDLKDARENENPSSNTPNLREIMDMEMAMAMYNADQSKSVMDNQRNDISTRLTWDLLVKEFPQVPQNIIAQIFSAYDFSYANTREALITSLPEYERDSHANAVKEVVSPEAIAAQEKALLEKAKMESLKFQRREMVVDEENDEIDEEVDENKGSWREMVEEARKSATLNRRLQKERHAQAQAANRSGMASAASYYCQMATLHKQKAEEETRKAANILSKVFTGRYGSSQGGRAGISPLISPPPTLDMHSMKVSEAVTVMNAFLDAHIECLRADKTRQPNDASRKSSSAKTKTLFLVTGRGMNSIGGIPRIKPAVEKQLEMRGVWYEEMNPGLLRVMISANQPTKRKVG